MVSKEYKMIQFIEDLNMDKKDFFKVKNILSKYIGVENKEIFYILCTNIKLGNSRIYMVINDTRREALKKLNNIRLRISRKNPGMPCHRLPNDSFISYSRITESYDSLYTLKGRDK